MNETKRTALIRNRSQSPARLSGQRTTLGARTQPGTYSGGSGPAGTRSSYHRSSGVGPHHDLADPRGLCGKGLGLRVGRSTAPGTAAALSNRPAGRSGRLSLQRGSGRRQALDHSLADASGSQTAWVKDCQPRERAAVSKKNVCKPWRKVMWCIGKITVEYRHRMYDLLALYAKAYQAEEPVVCVDEKSKQLLEQTRQPLAGKAGSVAKEDYEYKRAGTRNLFVAVEPKGCHREVEVTARRTKCDFVKFIGRLV